MGDEGVPHGVQSVGCVSGRQARGAKAGEVGKACAADYGNVNGPFMKRWSVSLARMAETARTRVWGREGHFEKARVASHARRRLIWKRLRD